MNACDFIFIANKGESYLAHGAGIVIIRARHISLVASVTVVTGLVVVVEEPGSATTSHEGPVTEGPVAWTPRSTSVGENIVLGKLKCFKTGNIERLKSLTPQT